MRQGNNVGSGLTRKAAIDVATAWAEQHHQDVDRCRHFAMHWHGETPADQRQPENLTREIAIFLKSAAKDAAYWRSIGDFTEEAAGLWSIQALKALGILNLVGLAASAILCLTAEGRLAVLGALGAGILFFVGAVLFLPAFKLAANARTHANGAALFFSQMAEKACTWEQLQSANNADPNVGRRQRKTAVRLGAGMIIAAAFGCVVLISAVWL